MNGLVSCGVSGIVAFAVKRISVFRSSKNKIGAIFMTSDLIFNSGIIICGAAVFSAVITIIVLRFRKLQLNKQLDAEFGKRRH